MNKAYKITLSALLTIILITLSFNCQPPATEYEPPRGTRWTGISHSNVSGNNYNISMTIYDNNTFSGKTTGADFTINFKGGGNLSASFNISGTGTITTISSGSDTFTINFTGTMSDTVMSGTYTVDYVIFPDDNGTFYLTRSSSSSSSEPPIVSSSSSFSSSSSSLSPPYLNNITVTPDSLNGAGQVKVMIDANDGGVGFQHISIIYASPLYILNNGLGHSFSISDFTYNSASGLWEAYCEFKNYYETGSWKISDISLQDNENNSIQYIIETSENLNNYVYFRGSDHINSGIPYDNTSLELTGTNPDITPPVLNFITISPNTINESGGIIKIQLNITEENTGIENISAIYYSPSMLSSGNFSGEIIPIDNFIYNSISGMWEASCTFQSTHESGIWKLTEIKIYDNAENEAYYDVNTNLNLTNYVLSTNYSYTSIITDIPINSGSLTKN